ncbi:MAG: MoaD/ThiS family protein [Candidatus Thorarchaeota archaeon]
MQVKFKSFGPIRRVLDSQVLTVDVPDGSTVRDVIDRVLKIGGPELERIVMEGDRISGNLIIMLNKKDVATLEGENTAVAHDDEIAMLPHVQGG